MFDGKENNTKCKLFSKSISLIASIISKVRNESVEHKQKVDEQIIKRRRGKMGEDNKYRGSN